MAGTGELPIEPHKTFDTILVLDFGTSTPRATLPCCD